MCGICGWIDSNVINRNVLASMINEMRHRGPDTQQVEIIGNAGLGHARLSIIDLSTAANQPITNEDKSIYLVFNGEFYNFHKYREELLSKGHVFQSKGDSEVIIHLYEEYGLDFLQKIRGMFAIAIWDQRKKRLVLARDRVGIKPLYYSHIGSTFVFASELKALVKHPSVSKNLDSEAVHAYFTLGYIPQNLSIFQGVQKLLPGSFLIYKDGKTKIEPYWVLPKNNDIYRLTEDNEVAAELMTRLNKAVRLRLISDVPLGVFLSGGVDSSVVAALAARNSSEPVKTFSIGFEEQEFNELPYARIVAGHIGSEHREFIVRINEADIIEKLTYYYDEPFGDSSAIPTYFVSKMAREKVTVALSGDGGDELFGGYNWYEWVIRLKRAHALPSWLRRFVSIAASRINRPFKGKHFLRVLDMDEFNIFKERVGFFSDGIRFRLLKILCDSDDPGGFARFYRLSGENALDRMSRTDFAYYLPEDILTKVDRASMAVSLEARVPILDHKVCELAYSLPEHFKIRNGIRKYILKAVAGKLLPQELDLERKQGFSVPLKKWMQGKIGDRVLEAVDQRTLSGIFNKQVVKQLINEHREGQADHSQRLWSILMFALWAGRYM